MSETTVTITLSGDASVMAIVLEALQAAHGGVEVAVEEQPKPKPKPRPLFDISQMPGHQEEQKQEPQQDAPAFPEKNVPPEMEEVPDALLDAAQAFLSGDRSPEVLAALDDEEVSVPEQVAAQKTYPEPEAEQ